MPTNTQHTNTHISLGEPRGVRRTSLPAGLRCWGGGWIDREGGHSTKTDWRRGRHHYPLNINILLLTTYRCRIFSPKTSQILTKTKRITHKVIFAQTFVFCANTNASTWCVTIAYLFNLTLL